MTDPINGTRVFVDGFGLNTKVAVETQASGARMMSIYPGGKGLRHFIAELELALAEVERRLDAAPALDSPAVRIEALEKDLALEKDRVKTLQWEVDKQRDIAEALRREIVERKTDAEGDALREVRHPWNLHKGAESALQKAHLPWYLFWKS